MNILSIYRFFLVYTLHLYHTCCSLPSFMVVRYCTDRSVCVIIISEEIIMLQNLYNMAGILGFVLSLILSLLEIRRRLRFLRLTDVKIVPMYNNNPDAYIYMVCTVSNPAFVQTAITSVSIRFPGLKALTALCDPMMIYNRRKNRSGDLTEFSSTPLPVNLPPRTSKRIVVMFNLSKSEIPPSLHLDPEYNRLKQQSIRVRIDLASLSGSLPRYRQADVADYHVEQETFLKGPANRS